MGMIALMKFQKCHIKLQLECQNVPGMHEYPSLLARLNHMLAIIVAIDIMGYNMGYN